MKHLAAIAAATDLPVSADLGNGFGDAPETSAETIRLAAGEGVVGGSIEDATGRPEHPIYEFEHAIDRVRAATQAARSIPFQFTLTARAEIYLHGRPDLKDTIKRLQAFQGDAEARDVRIRSGGDEQTRRQRDFWRLNFRARPVWSARAK